MAYSKTVWNNNTPPDISAENLNKMEQGIADAQFPDGGSTGQILSKTNDGTGWIDAPNSAEWGNITGQLSEQTDLVSQLDTKITMPSGGTTGQVLTKTASGQAWDDVDGLPSGGTAGQVLTKNSSTSGDASWQDVDGLPAGGTAGQVLTKNSSTDGDASWQTSPSGGGGTWGYISGTLTDQTDLVAALDAKANTSTLATVESTSTASQAYSVGDYLVYNGILYKVISAINSGETLTPNTNIEATTTGAELTSLNKSLYEYAFIETTLVNGDKSVDYPDGFTWTNCRVISFECYAYNSYRSGLGIVSNGFARLFYGLEQNRIMLYNAESALVNATCRLVLMKIS